MVCNPPFIVGPGFTADDVGFTYRDSGFASDSVSRRLVQGLPGVLAPAGTAQLLANWVIDAEQNWSERVAGWLPEHGVDAWIWQREVAEPGEYVALWLRDGGEQPGTDDLAPAIRGVAGLVCPATGGGGRHGPGQPSADRPALTHRVRGRATGVSAADRARHRGLVRPVGLAGFGRSAGGTAHRGTGPGAARPDRCWPVRTAGRPA